MLIRLPRLNKIFSKNVEKAAMAWHGGGSKVVLDLRILNPNNFSAFVHFLIHSPVICMYESGEFLGESMGLLLLVWLGDREKEKGSLAS